MREVAVLAMLCDEAECGEPCRSFPRVFGVDDCEDSNGVIGRTLPFAVGCWERGVAVCVDDDEAEESEGAGDTERDDVEEDGRGAEGRAACMWALSNASARSWRSDAVYC